MEAEAGEYDSAFQAAALEADEHTVGLLALAPVLEYGAGVSVRGGAYTVAVQVPGYYSQARSFGYFWKARGHGCM